jgi:uncharacterized tellurite resistance protein B-like protein
MDILSIIEEATREANSFENHPVKTLSLEEQLLYLQGLALVMNADQEIHEDEKEYLRILIKSFEMDQSSLDALVEFAQQPDKDTVQEFFRVFRRKPISQLFLFDALMMTRRDNKVCEREKAVVDKMAEQLEILKGTQKDIYDLFCHIKNRDWRESALYFSSHLLNPDHFKHLLDYFDVDFDELMERTADIRQQRLLEVLRPRLDTENWQWEPLRYSYFTSPMENATEITTHYVDFKPAFSQADIILPWMQSKLDRGDLRVVNQNDIFLRKDGEAFLCSLADSGLFYEPESRSFSVSKGSEVLKCPVSLLSEVVASVINSKTELQLKTIDQFDYICQILTGNGNMRIGATVACGANEKMECFPKFGDKYLKGEILSGGGERLVVSDGSEVSYTRSSKKTHIQLNELLFSGKFRLMR